MINDLDAWRRRHEEVTKYLNDRGIQRDDDGDLIFSGDEGSPFYITRTHLDGSKYWEVMPVNWTSEIE